MLEPLKIYDAIRSCGVEFFTGVPDSLLKEFCACVTDVTGSQNHVIGANEGGCIALATGHYLATGKCALVYMQNSGLGNAVNPLLSLADPEVYAVPMLLMIGWRGEPGVKDEPQHVSQGKVTLPMLESMRVPTFLLPENDEEALSCIHDAHTLAVEESRPVAIVVKKGTFAPYQRKDDLLESRLPQNVLTREQALHIILDMVGSEDVVVATTGKTSREVFELREEMGGGNHTQDFLTVGSMGHCSQIALGVALSQPDRRVVCLDGDGAMLMHMGSMAMIGQSEGVDLIHIILNNGAHESVGGQPTVARQLNVPLLGESLGYGSVASCDDEEGLRLALMEMIPSSGSRLLEIKISTGSRPDLGRPTVSPIENKQSLMNFLES